MKKGLVAFLLICVMVLSFAVPAMASTAVISEPISVATGGEQEIAPFTEMTKIDLFRNLNRAQLVIADA